MTESLNLKIIVVGTALVVVGVALLASLWGMRQQMTAVAGPTHTDRCIAPNQWSASRADECTKALTQDHPSAADQALIYEVRGDAGGLQRGDYDRAIDDFTQALALARGRTRSWIHRADAYRARAQLSEHGMPAAAQDRAHAIDDYSQAINLDRRDVTAWLGRCGIKREQRDFAGAIADCGAAVALEPGNRLVYLHRALVRDLARDYAGALADYGQMIALDPNDDQAYFLRAQVHQELGEQELAEADFKSIVDHNPNNKVTFRRNGTEVTLGHP